jgi:hypothetical protein
MVALAEGIKTLISGHKSEQCKAANAKLKAVVDKFKADQL